MGLNLKLIRVFRLCRKVSRAPLEGLQGSGASLPAQATQLQPVRNKAEGFQGPRARLPGPFFKHPLKQLPQVKPPPGSGVDSCSPVVFFSLKPCSYLFLSAAWAAASLATGTR